MTINYNIEINKKGNQLNRIKLKEKELCALKKAIIEYKKHLPERNNIYSNALHK